MRLQGWTQSRAHQAPPQRYSHGPLLDSVLVRVR